MTQRFVSLALVTALTLALSGCYTIRHYVDAPAGDVSLGPIGGPTQYHFKEEGRYFYLIGGLVPVMSPQTSELLARHQRKGSAISNLQIKQEYGIVDIGINTVVSILSAGFLTGMVQSMTITYEGDVVTTGNREGI